MSQEQVTFQSPQSGIAAPAAAPSLPDVNAETYPFEFVQYLLDQTADFSMFAIPELEYPETATLTPKDPSDYFGLNGGYGIALRSVLHGFESLITTPGDGTGVRVNQTVGEPEGTFSCRCFFCPDDYKWSLGQLPPPVIYDPWHSQHFVMLDTQFSFGEDDSFKGYGMGRTFPVSVNGTPQVLFGAVGNVMDGFGQFSGLNGTFVIAGTLTSSLGFRGSITCRIVDPFGYIRRDREVSSSTAIRDPELCSTFILLRGEKKDKSVKTTYGPSPGGGLVSLITPSQLRSVQCNFSSRGGGGVHTGRVIGPVFGNMDADVLFNLLAPPGTGQSPLPFTTNETYRFADEQGNVVGTLSTGVVEGISFNLQFPAAPEQAGVRFAGFGPITGGTGPFEGIQGMLTVNSLIGIAPHALSLLHVLHILDPEAKFRYSSPDV